MELQSTKVISNEFLGDGFFLLKVKNLWGTEISPGQFFQIRPSKGLAPFLSRPFSVFNADIESLWFLIKLVGFGTELLLEKKEDDTIQLLGPLGKGFPERSGVTLVAGGSGLGPLFYYAKRTGNYKRFLWGLKSKPPEGLESLLKGLNTFIVTEDGSKGEKGLVTDFVDDEEDRIIYACGPMPMLRSLKNFKKAQIWVSVETVMACGMGLCFGCSVKKSSDNGYFRACKDGPVFNLRDIKI